MNTIRSIRTSSLAACTLVSLAACAANRGYADDLESQLLDDLIERATPAFESARAQQRDGASSTAGPLAAAADDMRRAANAIRVGSAEDWDAAVAAQDAALAKLRRLLGGIDARTGQLESAGAAAGDQTSASQADRTGELSSAAQSSNADQPGGPPRDPAAPPQDVDPREGPPHADASAGAPSADRQDEEVSPGRSTGQTAGPDAVAGGGTAAGGARDEAAEVRLRAAIDRWQKMQWGMLPPRLREQVGGAAAAEFAEGYERSTAAYFEVLGRRLEVRAP